jgi:hypothetical protein
MNIVFSYEGFWIYTLTYSSKHSASLAVWYTVADALAAVVSYNEKKCTNPSMKLRSGH